MKVTCRAEEFVKVLFSLSKDVEYDFVIEEHKEKRSLSANSYLWALINEIANKLRESKEKVYQDMLREYGQGDTLQVSTKVKLGNYFKYYDVIDERDGKYIVRVYRGSSTYNTVDMSILIDGVVMERQNLGIDTDKERFCKGVMKKWLKE